MISKSTHRPPHPRTPRSLQGISHHFASQSSYPSRWCNICPTCPSPVYNFSPIPSCLLSLHCCALHNLPASDLRGHAAPLDAFHMRWFSKHVIGMMDRFPRSSQREGRRKMGGRVGCIAAYLPAFHSPLNIFLGEIERQLRIYLVQSSPESWV